VFAADLNISVFVGFSNGLGLRPQDAPEMSLAMIFLPALIPRIIPEPLLCLALPSDRAVLIASLSNLQLLLSG